MQGSEVKRRSVFRISSWHVFIRGSLFTHFVRGITTPITIAVQHKTDLPRSANNGLRTAEKLLLLRNVVNFSWQCKVGPVICCRTACVICVTQ